MSKREISVLNTTARYILICEFLERLAFYGISGSLLLFFVTNLDYSNEDAFNAIYIWTGFIYIAPLVGGYIADTHWNRYDTWIYFSVPYLIGFCIFTAACLPDVTSEAMVLIAMYLIAIGTGTIKPVIAALGADQFDVLLFPQDAIEYELFFSYFYWAINLGALISFSIIAYICQYGIDPLGGPDWGFFIAMFISTIAFAFAIISLMSGKSKYNIKKPQGSMFTTALNIVYDAIKVYFISCCFCLISKKIRNKYIINITERDFSDSVGMNERNDSTTLALLHDYNTASSNDESSNDKLDFHKNRNSYKSPHNIYNISHISTGHYTITSDITPGTSVVTPKLPRRTTGEDIEMETDEVRRITFSGVTPRTTTGNSIQVKIDEVRRNTITGTDHIQTKPNKHVSVMIDDANSYDYDDSSGYSGSNSSNSSNIDSSSRSSVPKHQDDATATTPTSATPSSDPTLNSGKINYSRSKYNSVDTAAYTVARNREEIPKRIPSKQLLGYNISTDTGTTGTSDVYRLTNNTGTSGFASNSSANTNENDDVTNRNTFTNRTSFVDMKSTIKNSNKYGQNPASLTQLEYQLRQNQKYNHTNTTNNNNNNNNNNDIHDDDWESYPLPPSWIDNANYNHQYDPSFIESVKYIARLAPFFFVMIPYWLGYGQTKTAFQIQACQMENKVGSFEFPLVAMNLFDALTIILCIPLCEKYLYPFIARMRNNRPLSMLQKIGIGLVLASLSMFLAAALEKKRLQTAPDACQYTDPGCLDNISVCRDSYNFDGNEYIHYVSGNTNHDSAPLYCHEICSTIDPTTQLLSIECVECDDVPQKSRTNILWQAPQYAIIGLSQIFASICSLELFYSEAPKDMRTISQALYYITNGFGNWFAIPLTLIVNSNENDQWITTDVNDGHLDLYFFLLAIIMISCVFIHYIASRKYEYVDQTILQSLSLSCELAMKFNASRMSINSNSNDNNTNVEGGKPSNVNIRNYDDYRNDEHFIKTNERTISNASVGLEGDVVTRNTLVYNGLVNSIRNTSVGSQAERRTLSINY